MKKLLLIIFSFFIFPILTYAVDNVDYDVTNYYIKANILSNGDLRVKELIVLDGSFNGYERNIYYANSALNGYDELDFEHSPIYNSDGIKDVKISAKYLSGVSYGVIDEEFEEFEPVSVAYKGDKHKYTTNTLSDGYSFRMYYESRGRKVGFLIEYTIDNAVVMHNDVAELYWQIFSVSPDNDTYKDVKVKVYLPGEDTKETFRYWAHGPIYGEIEKIENNNNELIGAYAYVDKLPNDEDMDIRMTFNKSLITNDFELDHTYVDAFDSILEVEQKRADEVNQERARLKKIYNGYKRASQIMTGIIVAAFIAIKFIILRKPKVDFDADYYREFIEDYNVEVIDYLYKKSLSPNALSAAIMNLIYKKKVTAEEIVDTNAKKESSKKDYTFTLVDREDLNASDTKLVEFLFDVVGDGTTFTTKGLKKYASSLSTGSKFNSSYTNWSRQVTTIGKLQNFFKSKAPAYIISVVLLLLSFIMQASGASYGVDYPLVYLCVLFSIILLISTAKTKAYNEKGALHLKKWNAFKNFLKDFGDFEPKELPEVKLWERYLVYATIFGLAKKVQKDMNVKIKEFDESVQTTYTDTFTHLYLYDSIRSSFSTAVSEGKRQYAASRANAYSSSSSGGGFGGGFSGGGGFGGGGGGGHGF